MVDYALIDIAEDKDERMLHHGGALPSCQKSQLPFVAQTTYKLIAIAEDQRILAHVRVLPSSWATRAP
jgi:hypothetical protein